MPHQSDKGINLITFYNAFHPVDQYDNPVAQNDYMTTNTYRMETGEEKIRRFVTEGNNRYAYSIAEQSRGKLHQTSARNNACLKHARSHKEGFQHLQGQILLPP